MSYSTYLKRKSLEINKVLWFDIFCEFAPVMRDELALFHANDVAVNLYVLKSLYIFSVVSTNPRGGMEQDILGSSQ
jgi:hypothetical protein